MHRFSTYLGLMLAVVAAVAVVFAVYVRAEKRIDRANEVRVHSMRFAEELRRSSDDLTRLVRTYVVTGQPIYKQRFQEIIDVRDGRRPRPSRPYVTGWELPGTEPPSAGEASEAVPLLDLMQRAGFSADEFAHMARAKVASDDLTRIEVAAMALVESGDRPAEVRRAEAIGMLHDRSYQEAKAVIMGAISQFQQRVDARTLAAVREAESNALRFRHALIVLGMLQLYLLWSVRRALQEILGAPVQEVYWHIANLGRGDFTQPITIRPGLRHSVLGWLAETRDRLAKIDAERKVAEQAIRDSEQRFRDIVNTTDGIVWEADARNFQFTFVSLKAERLLGFPVEEWLRPGFWVECLHPDDRAWAPAFCVASTARIEPHSFEYRFIARDGRPVWLKDIVTVVAEDGAPRWLRGIMVDVTQRKAADLELSRFKAIVDSTDDAIISKTLEGIIQTWNPGAERLFGYTAEEVVGSPMTILIPPDRLSEEPQILERIAAGERVENFATVRMHKDGRPIHISATISPIIDESGQVTGASKIARDISAQKRAEAEIRTLNAELERRVQERTAALEISNRSLVQAKELAESASGAKSAFLANMSHEIRTPLNAIVGMANIMRMKGVSPDQADRLSKIDAAAAHLLELINDILDLAKIEAGKFVLDHAPVRLDAILADVVAIISERAQAKGIRLLVECAPPGVELLGDPTRLQQALLNYVSNAVKFTESGSVTLRVVPGEETEDSVLLRFEVVDTGAGISPESMPRLFQAFEQADNSMTRKYGGTGLGLAITRRLAEMMGGTAGATSRPGQGSTFWFTARLQKASGEVDTGERHQPRERGRAQLASLEGVRVLVVDDEALNREVAVALLEASGAVVDTASDGAEAIARARATRYAAILMDMQMPNVDGIDATRAIRTLGDHGDVPILAMTANVFADDRARCLAAGMDDFLSKPFVPDDLVAGLQGAIRRHRTERAGQSLGVEAAD